MTLLENLQSICRERKISIPVLEKELGFGRGSIYKWDKNSPSIEKVQKVADYLKVSVDRVLYGFEASQFEQMVRFIMNKRTCEQFANDTGVDLEVIEDIAMGLLTEKPSIDVVKRIASSNPVQFIVDEESLYRAAGYSKEDIEKAEKDSIQTLAAHHDGEDWTEEELEEIERFKEFVRMKRKNNQE